MNIFKKLFKKNIFSSNNLIINKKKDKKISKKLEMEKRYNKFYSSPAWKNYQQEKEMDIYLKRPVQEDNLLSYNQRLDRIKAIEEGVRSKEIYFNNDEWYEKNKHRLWKYKSHFEEWYQSNKNIISEEWYYEMLLKFKK